MRKGVGIVLIFFVMILYFATSTLALESNFSKLMFEKGECYKDGSFSLVVDNFKTGEVYLADTLLTVSHDLYDYEVPVKGAWDKHMIVVDPANKSRNRAVFTSEQAQFNESGSYDVVLEYPGCSGNKACKTRLELEKCEPYHTICDITQVAMNSCVIQDGFATFSLTSSQHNPNIDPRTEVFYYVHSKLHQGIKRLTYSSNMKVIQTGARSYDLRFPIAKSEFYQTVSAVHRNCDIPSYRENTVECALVQEAVRVAPARIFPDPVQGAVRGVKEVPVQITLPETSELEEVPKPAPEPVPTPEVVAEPEPVMEAPEGLPEVTGNVVAETEEENKGLPTPLVLLVGVIMGGVVVYFFSNVSKEKKSTSTVKINQPEKLKSSSPQEPSQSAGHQEKKPYEPFDPFKDQDE
jgi:hypothetical protein